MLPVACSAQLWRDEKEEAAAEFINRTESSAGQPRFRCPFEESAEEKVRPDCLLGRGW